MTPAKMLKRDLGAFIDSGQTAKADAGKPRPT